MSALENILSKRRRFVFAMKNKKFGPVSQFDLEFFSSKKRKGGTVTLLTMTIYPFTVTPNY